MKQKNRRKKLEISHSINRQIRHSEVRITGDNVESRVLPIRQAHELAENMEMDLIEISPNANPPVCKIMDYQKFLYWEKKKQKEAEKKQRESRVDLKEMRFGPNTGSHDYEFKKKHIINFLKDGDKVKAFVFFKGREIKFKDQGEILLLKLAEEISEYGSLESMPKLEGKRLTMFIKPKKK